MIGVKTENGLPILPPVGVPDELLDDIQLKIFQYCNKIEPQSSRYPLRICSIDTRLLIRSTNGMAANCSKSSAISLCLASTVSDAREDILRSDMETGKRRARLH